MGSSGIIDEDNALSAWRIHSNKPSKKLENLFNGLILKYKLD